MMTDDCRDGYARVAAARAAATGRTGMKVLIVDDHPLIREALANVLAELGPQVVVLQAESLKGALAELTAHPDTTLILLDLMLPDGEGTSVLDQVRQAHPGVPVVVLSATDNRATVLAAIDGGAMGFISKRSASPVLVNALRLVLAGEVYIPPEVLRAETLPRPAAGAGLASAPGNRRTGEELGLTPRQMDVLTLLVQGKPNKVICRELGLAEGTVKTHTAAIFRALAVSNRTQAVFAVSRLGIQLPFVAAPGVGERGVSSSSTA
jgi:DNA-binding NarL/FixJ family response regulator